MKLPLSHKQKNQIFKVKKKNSVLKVLGEAETNVRRYIKR